MHWDLSTILIIVVILAASYFVAFMLIRSAKRSRQYAGDPSKKETCAGYIESIRETNWFVNNRPQIEIVLTLFPLNGPARTVTTRQVVGYIEIPYIQPGKYVNVSYEAGSFKNAHINGEKRFELSGDPFDMGYFDDIECILSKSTAQQTEGKILSVEKTGSLVDSLPIFRINARFLTADGKEIEGETLRILRPWAESQTIPGNTAKIVYDPQNPDTFTIIE